MEKLIELLNEYLPEWWSIAHWGKSVFFEWLNYNDRIIWKDFWFIKWLVDNDKIDRDNQALQYAKSDLSKFFTEWKDKNWMSDDYAMLLMLLSIQDNPIEFLISILK